jgi:hypothetical protein
MPERREYIWQEIRPLTGRAGSKMYLLAFHPANVGNLNETCRQMTP